MMTQTAPDRRASPTLEFVNHASVVLRTGDVHLISDPWLDGTTFHDGWSLLAGSRFAADDFRGITHIWLSHEHPDHFSPPTLRNISPAVRATIVVLYRPTKDGKVVRFCRQLGFKDVVELPLGRWFELAPRVRLLCFPYDDDSALAIQAGSRTIVNLNDCIVNERAGLASLKRLVGDVDVLLTQFSYARYVGETVAKRRRHAEEIYRQMHLQSEVLAPRYLIPFGSYVWFCHEENHYMNDAVNRIDDVVRTLQGGTSEPIVLYPSERWAIGATHDVAASVARYMNDYEDVAHRPLVRAASVDLPTLRTLADAFAGRVSHLRFAVLLRLLGVVPPLRIWLTDHQRGVSLGLHGLTEVSLGGPQQADVSMSSDVLGFCLRFDYGFTTTDVNGRFHVHSHDGLRKLRRFSGIGSALNHGRSGVSDMMQAAARKAVRIARARARLAG